MKCFKNSALPFFFVLALSACGGGGAKDSQPEQPKTPKQININGAVEKGPFIAGSTVTINELNEQGNNTGSTIVTSTIDDLGNFSFSAENDKLLQITSTGYYRNEITGELSRGTLTLRSIYQASNELEQHAYVNLLTHLTSNRILQLVKTTNTSYQEAIQQAEIEFLTTFEPVIKSNAEDNFSSLSIYESQGSTGSAYLLAVSSIFHQYALEKSSENNTNPETELTILANEIEEDFGNNGVINDENKIQSLKATHTKINPVEVHQNVQQWIGNTDGYLVTDINNYLDSDLDGIVNANDPDDDNDDVNDVDDLFPFDATESSDNDLDGIGDNADLDDDNDGIEDTDDESPFVKNFKVSNQSITVDEDITLNINISSNNPLGEEIKIEILNAPKHGVLAGSYPDLQYIPNKDYNGTDIFTYVLSQPAIVSSEAVINITVEAINDQPIITGNPDTFINALNEYSFRPSAHDIENKALTFTIENKPLWAIFDENSGTLTGTPTNANTGVHNDITISVSDGELTNKLPVFSIQVNYSVLAPPTELNSNVSGSSNSKKPLSLKWTSVEFAASYAIEIASDEDFTTITYIGNNIENNITLEHIVGNHFWRVRTINPDGVDGNWSEVQPLKIGVFTKHFGGSKDDRAKQIINTKDGSHIILASTKSSEISNNVDSAGDDWIFKVNSQGELLWQYVSNAMGRSRLEDIIELTDGTIIAVGQDSDSNQAVALKLDESGNNLWEILYRPDDISEQFDFLDIVEFNNAVYVSSSVWGTGDCADCSIRTNYFLHTISAIDGTVSPPLDIPLISGLTFDSVSELAVTKDGNLIIAGAATPEGNNMWWNLGAYFQILDTDFNQVTTWNNVSENSHLNVGDAITLSNGIFAIIGQGISGGVSISLVDKQDNSSNNYYSSDQEYTFSSIASDNESGLYALLKDHNINKTPLTFMTFDNNLTITSQYHLLDLKEYVTSAGLVTNKDGTLTFLISEGQSSYNNYDIVLIRK